MSQQAIDFLTASRASIGARAHQEDCSRVWRQSTAPPVSMPLPAGELEGGVLAVLADGMGGHVSGELASRLACENFVKAFERTGLDGGAGLQLALETSNDSIRHAVAGDVALKGMGCTLVASYLSREGLRWASVGDSALLIYRDGQLSRLNADHSHGAMLDKQVEAGIITAEVALSDRRRRALRSALTGNVIPIQEIEAEAYPLAPGDWVILASDGLLTLSGDEIATVISDFESSSPGELADALLDAVAGKQAPHQDNTTIVAISVVAPAKTSGRTLDDFGDDEDDDGNSETMTFTRPVMREGRATFQADDESEASRGGASKVLLIGLAVALIAAAGLLMATGGDIGLLPSTFGFETPSDQ